VGEWLSCFNISYFVISFLLSSYCCTWDMLWHWQKCLFIVEFTTSIILLYTHAPILRIVSTGLIFYFHIWVHSISTIFILLHPFLLSSPLPLVPTPRQDLFYFLVICFWGEKSHFCFFKIFMQRVPLCHFHVYMYCIPKWFIPSIFLFSTLVLFL
jgi:hypothetical protein